MHLSHVLKIQTVAAILNFRKTDTVRKRVVWLRHIQHRFLENQSPCMNRTCPKLQFRKSKLATAAILKPRKTGNTAWLNIIFTKFGRYFRKKNFEMWEFSDFTFRQFIYDGSRPPYWIKLTLRSSKISLSGFTKLDNQIQKSDYRVKISENYLFKIEW